MDNTQRDLWPVKDLAALTQDLKEADDASRSQRAERLSFLIQEFGPPASMMLTGGLNAALVIDELQSSFLNGNFMATILLCQVFVESSLGGSFAFSGDEQAILRGFRSLIDRSAAESRISQTLADRLHSLTDMRNPHNHPRPENGLLDRVATYRLRLPKLSERDAREAIHIVVDFLREGCPTWTPRAAEARTGLVELNGASSLLTPFLSFRPEVIGT